MANRPRTRRLDGRKLSESDSEVESESENESESERDSITLSIHIFDLSNSVLSKTYFTSNHA